MMAAAGRRTLGGPLTGREMFHGRELAKEEIAIPPLPETRGDCIDGPRPCLHVRCRYHLALNVNLNGVIEIPHGDVDLAAMEETCALDVADSGPVTLEEIGELFGITRAA